MKNLISTLSIVLLSVALHAQTGEITGKVIDAETGMSVPEPHIIVMSDGIKVMELSGDAQGVFVCKPLKPATYDLFVLFIGYDTAQYYGLRVRSNAITYQDILMSTDEMPPVIITPPLVDAGDPTEVTPIDAGEFYHMAVSSPLEAVQALVPKVQVNEQSGGLNIAGSREDATLYVIDGVRVVGSLYVPMRSIKEISVITGGIPAKYGDVTGGIVEITTKNYGGIF